MENIIYTKDLINEYGAKVTDPSEAVIVDSHILGITDSIKLDWNIIYDNRSNCIVLSIDEYGAEFPTDRCRAITPVLDGTREDILDFVNNLESLSKSIREVCGL